jgi:hypothetical protein
MDAGGPSFTDIASYIHTGGQSALVVILWIVYQGVKKAATIVKTLEDIRDQLQIQSTTTKQIAEDVDRKLESIHNAVIEMPMNVFRTNKAGGS